MADPRLRRLIGCGFGGAMIAAPFLALLFDLAAGLAVMAFALAATAWLALDAARTAEQAIRRRLRIVASVNGVLVAACLIVAAIELT